MSNLKQLRNRVKSVKSTQKITKVMQLVSAAKLKRVKEQAEGVNHYSEVLASLMRDLALSENMLAELPEEERQFFSDKLLDLPTLLIVMTSERGLCGSFNSSVVKYVKRDIAEFVKAGKKVRLLVIGKKGYDGLKLGYSDLIEEYFHIPKDHFEHVAFAVKDKIISMIKQKQVGPCYTYYNKFKNALTQIMTKQLILPVKEDQLHDEAMAKEPKVSAYEYEGEGLVQEVVDLYIGGQINYSLLQSKAGEEGARMTAMDNATRNAGKLIGKLTLKLNRTRQAIITTELTEIISGAEAV